jgi:hypothetical protein
MNIFDKNEIIFLLGIAPRLMAHKTIVFTFTLQERILVVFPLHLL